VADIGLFYGSTTGNTLHVAELIEAAFRPFEVDLHDVRKASPSDMNNYDIFVFGTSTWHWGGLQDEWAIFEDELDKAKLEGKKVALFGVGDQKRYPGHFVDGIGLLHDKTSSLAMELIGTWPTDGYDYLESAAEIDGKFAGLVLDEDNESDKTQERVTAWVSQLKKELGLKDELAN
jgi:flavodoxin I